jgi:hypothetical protein
MNALRVRDEMALHKFKIAPNCSLKNVLVHLEISGSANADDDGTCRKNFG